MNQGKIEASTLGAFDLRSNPAIWQFLGAVALSTRLVLGWVYWGGASRRFIYAPAKLDPSSPAYLANKLVHAAPGAAFGFGHIMHWLMAMPTLLHVAVIGFSLVELVVGVGLIFGFATRILSLASIGLSITLMIIFGWMGTTCQDEWTMAACSFAMSCLTLATGSGPWSVDNLIQRSCCFQKMPWLSWFTSGPLPLSGAAFIRLTKILGIISIIFAVFFYGYNFNAIYSPLSKRVNPTYPAIALSNPVLTATTLSVHGYVDAGPDTQGLYVMKAELSAPGQAAPIFSYNAKDLSQKGFVTIKNLYAPWSSCKAIAFGLRCQLGSKSVLSFPLPAQHAALTGQEILTLIDVEGKKFSIAVK